MMRGSDMPIILATGSRIPWIELCQAIGIDPHDLVVAHLDRLLRLVLEASKVGSLPINPFPGIDMYRQGDARGFVEASYRTITTLTFVAPEQVIPQLLAQVQKDVSSVVADAFTDEDLAIWAHSEVTPYIDGQSNLPIPPEIRL